ncbi:unnamed protein product [Echinostoma caproni]|uniref:Nuclear receptor domain-containing protein n=1 Tax=Echinostoma caproni TaxID=27848 RepID=A0A183AF97_9TREM|nr:unnamed protein product [Echinostoma caproni]
MHSRRKKKRRLAAAVAAAQQAGARGFGKSGTGGTAAAGTGIGTGLGSALGSGEFGSGDVSDETRQALVGNAGLGDLGSAKKCRARFGLEHQHRWCKPCRRKKKCIRFLTDAEYDESEFPSSPPSIGISATTTGTGGTTAPVPRDSSTHPTSLYASSVLPTSVSSSVADLARCSSSSSEPSVSQSGAGAGGVDLWSCYVPNLPGSGPKTSPPDTPSGRNSYAAPSRTPNPAPPGLPVVRRQSADHTSTTGPNAITDRFKRESSEELSTSGSTSLLRGSSCPVGGTSEAHAATSSHLASIVSFSATGCG